MNNDPWWWSDWEQRPQKEPPDTPLLDYLLGRTDTPPPQQWRPSDHKRLVDHLWGTPMPSRYGGLNHWIDKSSVPTGPVKSFTSPGEVEEFHAEIAAWLKEQR